MEKFKKWLDNYWYHYKWQTLIALVFIVTLVIGLGQIVLEKNEYDVYLLYAGPAYLEGDVHNAIVNDFEKTSEKADISGGGSGAKKDVNLQTVTYMSKEQIEKYKQMFEEDGNGDFIYDGMKNYTAYETFKRMLVAGDNVILLLDPSLFADAKNENALYPVKDILGRSVKGTTDDGYGIVINASNLAGVYPSLSSLPDGTVMCFRTITHAASMLNKDKNDETHTFQLQVAKTMFEDIE